MADEADIYAAVAGNSGVSALVSTRVYDQRLPKNADPLTSLPYIVGRVVSDVPSLLLNETPGVALYHIQFDIVARTKASAKAVLAALRTCLEALPSNAEILTQDVADDEYDLRVIKTDWEFWLAR